MHSPVYHPRFLSMMRAAITATVVIMVTGAMVGPAWSNPPAPPSPGPWKWQGNIGDNPQTPEHPGRGGGSGGDGPGRQPVGGAPSSDRGCRTVTPADTGCDTLACGPLSAISGCQPAGGGVAVPAVTPQDLLQQALYELRLPKPQIVTAPPRGTEGVVGLAEWFWLDPAQRTSRSVRQSAGDVWVELTASPQTMTVHPGGGHEPVSCPGGGVPYQAGAAASAASCTVTYTRSSARQPENAYQVTATVSWGGTWRGSGGVGGALTPITVTSTLPVRIAEGQALNGGGR
ncbi:hypothetical protein [Actinomadura sp. 6K520]|uniref:hypothetical protein n=1 Tax=Actinomadura sp. 6K520 TaxID=2530364 RepID=UPI0014044829|nr:hypothetical protein [Actinomadura sp. 6K520]